MRRILTFGLVLSLWSMAASAQVVISQIYGCGNSGATYRNEYAELFNRSASAASSTPAPPELAPSAAT